MTRKTSAMLGLGALLLALLVGQIGSGQMPNPMPMGPQGPSPQMQVSPEALEREIELLIALNRMGLSPEQLQQLQQIISGLQAPQQAHRQHREELRQFLLSWQGSPEEFELALQNFRQERRQRLEQLQAQNRDLIDRLKDVLTYRQGELLYQALRKLSASKGMGGMGMPMMMGGKGQQPMGRQGGPAHGAAPGRPPMMMGMGPMGMMPMMQQHMQMMQQMRHMMGPMGPGAMGMGMIGMGRMGQGPAQVPKLEELIAKHAELLQRVIAQKLQALQGQ